MQNLERLINELRKLPNETPWVEFKHNNYKPEMIGQDISAWQTVQHCTKRLVPICSGALMTQPMRLSGQAIICNIEKRQPGIGELAAVLAFKKCRF